MGKLLGFDFSMEYKPENTNTMVDDLSCFDMEVVAVLTISSPWFDFLDHLRQGQAMTLVKIQDEI